MKKRGIAIILTLCLLLTAFPSAIWAETVVDSGTPLFDAGVVKMW